MSARITLLGLAAWAGAARAHEGHGLPGASHWHASDVLGLLLAAGVGVGLWWFSRRK